MCSCVSHPNFLMVLDWSLLQYTLAMMGYGDDELKTTVLELTYNYGVTEYTKGDGYGQVNSHWRLLSNRIALYAVCSIISSHAPTLRFQIALGTNDVYKTAEAVKTFGGKIVREPGPLPILNTKITAVLDPDGWKSVRSCVFSQFSQSRREFESLLNFLDQHLSYIPFSFLFVNSNFSSWSVSWSFRFSLTMLTLPRSWNEWSQVPRFSQPSSLMKSGLAAL